MATYEETGDKTPQVEQVVNQAIEKALVHTWTAIPGIVDSFNPEKQIASVKVVVKQEYPKWGAGETAERDHPILSYVPVCFPGGSRFHITYNLEPGDTGLVIFSARALDDWLEHGKILKPAVRRKHSFSDALFLPGFRSFPEVITEFQPDGIEIRNKSRTSYIRLNDNGVAIQGTVLTHNNVDIGNSHKHDRGTYKDAEQRPLSGGCSGPPGC
jgi:hypothetical protein